MSGETEGDVSGWTTDTLKYLMDREIYHAERFADERDRRYKEVAIEKDRAVAIKEVGDAKALEIERAQQTYKDEQANKLREQINNERGLYATKEDLANLAKEFAATIKPLVDYVSSQQGRSGGQSALFGWAVGVLGVAIALAALLIPLSR